MTLGNDAQPLTRRQARELAERQPQPTAEPGDQPPAETAAVEAPQSTKAARRARSTDADPADSDPANADPARADPASADVTAKTTAGTAQTPVEHTLTRRELRARAAAHPTPDEDASPATSDAAANPVRSPVVRPSAVRSSSPRTPAPVSVDENVPIPPVPASFGRSAPEREISSPSGPFDASRLPGLHPPVGHWSVDRDEDEDAASDGGLEPFDQLMARGFGAGGIPTTTNALILPSIPNQGTASGPLSDSGEILITGSFDLPRSLGSTGQLPNHFDSSEMDHMHDQFDDDAANGAAAPVSASRAVSTHASTRNVMAAPKRTVPSLPAVLAITAAVLAVGVLALFVGGYLLNIF